MIITFSGYRNTSQFVFVLNFSFGKPKWGDLCIRNFQAKQINTSLYLPPNWLIKGFMEREFLKTANITMKKMSPDYDKLSFIIII